MKTVEIGMALTVVSLVNISFSLEEGFLSQDYLIGSLIGGVLIFVAGLFIDGFLKARKEILAPKGKVE